MMRLRFGKYKGFQVSSVPDDDYLEWLSGIAREPLKTAVDTERRRRSRREESRHENRESHAVRALPPAVRAAALEVISSGYRSLALKHHPDHNGSNEQMLAINEAVAYLREAVS